MRRTSRTEGCDVTANGAPHPAYCVLRTAHCALRTPSPHRRPNQHHHVESERRQDDPVQNERVSAAYQRGLIDYIEVNYPIPFSAEPEKLGIPVLAHTSSNPTCSAEGVNLNIARRVKEGADATNSPWIGEHLSWLGIAPTGSLGYQINPLFTDEFEQIWSLGYAHGTLYAGTKPASLLASRLTCGPCEPCPTWRLLWNKTSAYG